MFGLRAHFSFVDGGEMGRHKHEQLRDLLRADVITPDAVMVGDREVDVSAARANGLQVAAVLWGHGSAQELQDAQPDWLLARPAEVLGLPIVN
jgi:phosphoglycolate phosphatase